MSSLPIVSTALAGVRFVRDYPKTVAIWVVAVVALWIIVGAALVATTGPSILALEAAQRTGQQALAGAHFARVWPPLGLLAISYFPLMAIVLAVMNRAILRPDDWAFGYLRVGKDELRQLALILLAVLVAIVIYLVVRATTLGIVYVLSRRHRTMLGLIALTGLAGGAGTIWIAIRMSLASAHIFYEERMALVGAWRLTRGRFWRLFAVYALVGVLVTLVSMICLGLQMGAAFVLGGSDGLAQMARPNLSSVAAYFSPIQLASILFSSAALALTFVIGLMPAAEAYVHVVSEQAAETEETEAAADEAIQAADAGAAEPVAGTE